MFAVPTMGMLPVKCASVPGAMMRAFRSGQAGGTGTGVCGGTGVSVAVGLGVGDRGGAGGLVGCAGAGLLPRKGVGDGGGSVGGRAVEVPVGVLNRSAMLGVGERVGAKGTLAPAFVSAMKTRAP